MNVLIIEDEEPAADMLVAMLKKYDEEINVLAILASVEAGVKWLLENTPPNLIMLDIHLSDGLCFEIFKRVSIKCPVIFCTAYDQYALNAFQVNSIDYLLKPLKYEKLENSLQKMKDIQAQIKLSVNDDQINDIIKRINNNRQTFKTRFMVRLGTKIKAIKSDEIAYFHAKNKLTLLVTKEGKNFPLDYTLDELMELLDPVVFFHVNRSLIIHIDAAKEIHPYFKGRLKLVLSPPLDEEIVISSQKTPLFKAWLDH